ncbi:hypothetical protein KL908_004166 [Ogataea polymorpha]|nr:hypothetical protein KL908_004166 [Ogataea polymorpha]
MSQKEKDNVAIVYESRESETDPAAATNCVQTEEQLSPYRWNNPFLQVAWGGLITAMTSGLYVALTGIGAGGGKPESQAVSSIGVSLGDATWIFSSFAAGILMNKIRPRFTLMLGAAGFSLYVAGYWYFDVKGQKWFPITAGTLSGCVSGFLWATQNFLIACYAKENEKGTYVALNHIVFVCGGVIGSMIAVCLNRNVVEGNRGVVWELYLIFVIVNVTAVVFAYFTADPDDVRRNDGSKIAVFKPPTVKQAVLNMLNAFKEVRILLMITPLFVAECLFPFFSSLNSHMFTTRARTLNNMFFWFAQIPGAWVFGWLTDRKGMGRRGRGYLGLFVTFLFVNGAFIGVAAMMGTWGLEKFDRAVPLYIDWKEKKFGGLFVWYFIAGFSYSLVMSMRVWITGSFSNDPQKQAPYAGIIPMFQALGVTVGFGIDAASVPYLNIMCCWWILYVVGMALEFVVIRYHIADTDYFKEEDVVVPAEFATILQEK